MEITILADNRPHPLNHALETEHGLSIHIKTRHENLLLDTGASDIFLRNAAALGIDIADVDYLILSHAHSDHTGGLAHFLSANSQAKIYLSANTSPAGYFSTRCGRKRDISIDWSLIERHRERFVFVERDTRLSPSTAIIADIPVIHSLPKANSTLLAGAAPDQFDHEIALTVTDGETTVLLSSCTHLGLLNTLETCRPAAPDIFIGGLHLVDSDKTNRFESEDEIRAIAETLRDRYLLIYAGHCTGDRALLLLASLLPGAFRPLHTALKIAL